MTTAKRIKPRVQSIVIKTASVAATKPHTATVLTAHADGSVLLSSERSTGLRAEQTASHGFLPDWKETLRRLSEVEDSERLNGILKIRART